VSLNQNWESLICFILLCFSGFLVTAIVLPPTVSGYRYWMVFVDDYSLFWVVTLLKRKSDAFDAFKSYKAHMENVFGTKILALHDDKGGEYMSNAFQRFCDEAGIARRHTVRNRPQQNGDAERANRIIR
jgi:transposase InsO family protein